MMRYDFIRVYARVLLIFYVNLYPLQAQICTFLYLCNHMNIHVHTLCRGNAFFLILGVLSYKVCIHHAKNANMTDHDSFVPTNTCI